MSTPTPNALAQRAALQRETAPSRRHRGPYTTATQVVPMQRTAGDGYGFTTDPAQQRGLSDAEKNARRLATLLDNVANAHRRCELHHGKNADAYRKACDQVDHYSALIVQGRCEGRWE